MGWRALADLHAPSAAEKASGSVTDAVDDVAYIVRTDTPPPMVKAAKARIADDAEVIGIDSPFGPRAYVLSAMTMISNHIVNDHLANGASSDGAISDGAISSGAHGSVLGAPLSLTYCDRTDCLRVFTRPGAQGLLDLRGAGLHYGEMYIALEGEMYRHEDSALPLEEVEFVRTDWKTWRQTRPNTLVFDGKQPKSERTSPASGSRQAS